MQRLMHHEPWDLYLQHSKMSSECVLQVCHLLNPLIHYLTGVNFKEVNEENKQKLFGEIYAAIDTLAFTFGNV